MAAVCCPALVAKLPGSMPAAARLSLNGVMWVASEAWLAWMLRVSIVAMIDTPIEEPRLRTRLKRPVASVRKRGSRVWKATVESGMKTKPRPNPWMMPEVIIGHSCWRSKALRL